VIVDMLMRNGRAQRSDHGRAGVRLHALRVWIVLCLCGAEFVEDSGWVVHCVRFGIDEREE
jgi:hypothetical protein